MSVVRTFQLGLFLLLPLLGLPQERDSKGLPDVSITFKGDMLMPLSHNNPLFNGATETVGQLGGCLQLPLWKGLGIGAGLNHSWWTLRENAFTPFLVSGTVRRLVYYGKLQYEKYTGPRTFYEFNARFGTSTYTYDCAGCIGAEPPALFWSIGAGYYLHATENLSFGLLIGYESQGSVFEAADLGLNGFPGRTETAEASPYHNWLVGLGFSTRLRRSERDVRGW